MSDKWLLMKHMLELATVTKDQSFLRMTMDLFAGIPALMGITERRRASDEPRKYFWKVLAGISVAIGSILLAGLGGAYIVITTMPDKLTKLESQFNNFSASVIKAHDKIENRMERIEIENYNYRLQHQREHNSKR